VIAVAALRGSLDRVMEDRFSLGPLTPSDQRLALHCADIEADVYSRCGIGKARGVVEDCTCLGGLATQQCELTLQIALLCRSPVATGRPRLSQD
jgi:hypothetical protein